jgi:hypothetical protein
MAPSFVYFAYLEINLKGKPVLVSRKYFFFVVRAKQENLKLKKYIQ